MTNPDVLQGLVAEFEEKLEMFNKTPGYGKAYAAKPMYGAFSKIVEEDRKFAFEMIADNEQVGSRCRGSIPAILAGFRDSSIALTLLERVRCIKGTDASTFIEIGKAARKRSKLRRAAFDTVVAMAEETSDWLSRARFCTQQLARLQEVSPEHAERLAGTLAAEAGECPINCESDYKAAYELAAQLSLSGIIPEVRDEISRRLRTYERLRTVQKEFDSLRATIATSKKHLAEAPATEEDFNRELDELMRNTVTIQDEDDGEFYDQPAFDGTRLCIGDGDDMVDFWGSFGVFAKALRDLMSEIDTEEVVIKWSRCPIELSKEFGEFAEGLVGGFGGLDRYLDDNGLADVQNEGWDGGAPGCSGVWLRVWIPRDQVVPVLRHLWSGYRFAASIVLPVLEDRLRDLVN
jgi:hypothetical protein